MYQRIIALSAAIILAPALCGCAGVIGKAERTADQHRTTGNLIASAKVAVPASGGQTTVSSGGGDTIYAGGGTVEILKIGPITPVDPSTSTVTLPGGQTTLTTPGPIGGNPTGPSLIGGTRSASLKHLPSKR